MSLRAPEAYIQTLKDLSPKAGLSETFPSRPKAEQNLPPHTPESAKSSQLPAIGEEPRGSSRV